MKLGKITQEASLIITVFLTSRSSAVSLSLRNCNTERSLDIVGKQNSKYLLACADVVRGQFLSLEHLFSSLIAFKLLMKIQIGEGKL